MLTFRQNANCSLSPRRSSEEDAILLASPDDSLPVSSSSDRPTPIQLGLECVNKKVAYTPLVKFLSRNDSGTQAFRVGKLNHRFDNIVLR